MTRTELIELAEKIQNAAGATEAENDNMLELFLANVPDPNASNYFFEVEYNALSPEEIADKALRYKPFQL
ncbi:hypothetical protein [Pedobacter punctiformis]|uniref:Colicin immunity protein / pyocin immunity protein n=1 Tax=Pedobacter punctiformis TaxID=3004097 RepID=A0ABT4L8C0_9SPHI|nr:hypothetical protein [Pedobacter sp. HCMS5-2]MCZ4244163.1 hypothetical protein [Pedobacter sp. HCMS5-2]